METEAAPRATLYRAADQGDWFGFRSFWTTSRESAERYVDGMAPFGGPHLYVADVEPEPCLDLRVEPWTVIHEELGLDRADYGEGESDIDLFQALAPVMAAHGSRWSLEGPNPADEWMYLGQEPIAATKLG